MKFGTITSDINGLWIVEHDSGELAGAVTTYSITGLNGDVDCEYQLISRVVNGYNGAQGGKIRFNNDSGSNYGYQYMYGTDTTTAAGRNTSDAGFTFLSFDAINKINLNNCYIQAKSGYVRTINWIEARNIATTTVGLVLQGAGSWNNTSSNITSIDVVSNQASGIGIGSRFILLKKVHNTGGTKTGIITPNTIHGCWKRIYDNTLSGAATSVTVSGLTGNTNPIIRVRARIINGYNGGVSYVSTFNTDTGTNYGYQYLYAANTSCSAARSPNGGILFFGADSLNKVGQFDMIIFSPSGKVRPCLVNSVNNISGTTVGHVHLSGNVWNNTADEITSIVLTANQANGLGIGTHIEVDALIV